MMLRPLVIAWKELLQLRRDRMTLAMMVMLPLVQLMLFGYAINTDVRHIRTVVYDSDRSAASRDLVRSLEATRFYDVVGYVQNYAEIEAAFRASRARVALVVPPLAPFWGCEAKLRGRVTLWVTSLVVYLASVTAAAL